MENEKDLQEKAGGTQEKEKAFSQISKRSFVMVLCLLLGTIFVCFLLTYIIPQGRYERDQAGMIIADQFYLGKVKGFSLWSAITAPIRVFASQDALTIIMISVFLLVMSGVFNLVEKTGGIRSIIGKTIRKFSNMKRIVVCITTFLFMLFGSLFGMFEELVTLLPLIIVFMLSMGFDSLTGLGVCMMAACFGFSAAITNPFSVGIIADLADTHAFDGVWLRILFFVIILVAVSCFLLRHIRKITNDPKTSLTYEIDQKKLQGLELSFQEEVANEQKVFKIYVSFFIVQLVVLVSVACIRAISDFAIPILAASFLIGGIICGLFVCEKKLDCFYHIGKGAVAMFPAILLIALASSVKLIMTESGIMDTVIHGIILALEGQNKFVCVVLIYFLILVLQVFIGSSSAKIMLIMPIILPIAQTIGLSPALIILTYCIADGFTDVLLPTNPVLIIGLSVANVSYGKWVRWTWKFQVAVFIFTIFFLLFAVSVGY